MLTPTIKKIKNFINMIIKGDYGTDIYQFNHTYSI